MNQGNGHGTEYIILPDDGSAIMPAGAKLSLSEQHHVNSQLMAHGSRLTAQSSTVVSHTIEFWDWTAGCGRNVWSADSYRHPWIARLQNSIVICVFYGGAGSWLVYGSVLDSAASAVVHKVQHPNAPTTCYACSSSGGVRANMSLPTFPLGAKRVSLTKGNDWDTCVATID